MINVYMILYILHDLLFHINTDIFQNQEAIEDECDEFHISIINSWEYIYID